MAYRSDPLLSWAFHQEQSLGSAIWALMLQEIHIKEDFEVKQLRLHRKPKSGEGIKSYTSESQGQQYSNDFIIMLYRTLKKTC